ncbi:7659_t:CDS:2, partial [Paraglomus occultum]
MSEFLHYKGRDIDQSAFLMRSAESQGEGAVNVNPSDKNRETDHSDKEAYYHIVNAEEMIDPVAIRKKSLTDLAVANHHVGAHLKCIRPTDDIFNPEDPKIREDIIRMIIQYLSDEGYTAARTIVYDEANVKWHEREERVVEAKRLKKAILDGDWTEVDKLCAKPLLRNHKSFLYAVYKQQYLEYIEHQEMQK